MARWRVLYIPPLNTEDINDPDTWRKAFYLDEEDYPETLDLDIKIYELIKKYKMKKEYVTIQDLKTGNSRFFFDKK